jgi:prophage tail gpP-like protein
MLETVTIGSFPPFEDIKISVSAEEASRTASGSFVITGSGVPVMPGDAAVLTASGDVMLTGYARDVAPSYDASGKTRVLALTMVSRTIDATECSVVHPTGEVLNKNLADVAREFDTMGIGIEDDGTVTEVEPRHKLEAGESLFSTIETRARSRGILIHDTPQGKLKLASKPEGMHSGSLRRGIGGNIKAASAKFTEEGRFSDISVRGQVTEGTESPQLRGQSTVKDQGVKRYRPLIIRHEGEVSVDRMKKRAEWHARRAAGEACTATVTTIGWRDEGGLLWTPNYLVYVQDDWIAIEGMMIIKSVEFAQDGQNGTVATLNLADPRALGGENPRGDSSDGYDASTESADFTAE